MKRIDLYPKNASADLDPALFANPTSEYRAAPFWSWNNKLDKGQLCRQIDVLKRMGMGGFHMHPRTGMATEYLSEDFFEVVRACCRKAEQEGMLAWLYDEDRWPSGFAGGLVTQDSRCRLKHLLFTPTPYAGQAREQPAISRARASRNEDGKLLAVYDVVLEEGRLVCGKRIDLNAEAKGTKWYAYLETSRASSWFNNQAYLDTLSRQAVQRFVETTHEAYKRSAAAWFGKTVPAIFTDEPQFAEKHGLQRASQAMDLFMPWTDDFAETYMKAYGADILDSLPELFWERADGIPSVARYRYHDHTAERFAQGFCDTIGQWCAENGIALTGHLMAEQSLGSQSGAVGECMRGYRSFQIPGIDILCDAREYGTAKQAQSVARQMGRPGVLSELYGVTSWSFTFNGHKNQGDWQAALGVTVRVPHLAWVSMAGEAKRDYPASIGYQSPWWAEYPLVEDHFARVNVALTRGLPQVPIAVIHPIESYWLCMGPMDQTAGERSRREEQFEQITSWLLYGLVDFDFVSESLLPSLASERQGFGVGFMEYKAVLVPSLRTIRSTTLDLLEKFADRGGTIVFAGEIPSLVDASPSLRAIDLARRCQKIPFDRVSVLNAVRPFADIAVTMADGREADSLLYQMRDDNGKKRLFLCNTDREFGRDVEIALAGEFAVELMDTFSGEVRPVPAAYANGKTVLPWRFEGSGSALFTLIPGKSTAVGGVPGLPRYREVGRLDSPVPVELCEPNALLLDQARFRIGDEPWSDKAEVLRLANAIRARLGLPEVTGNIVQPWADKEPCDVKATVQVLFEIETQIDLCGCKLAMEDPETLTIRLDGVPIASQVDGWWVDESIRTVPMPPIRAGRQELVVEMPFHRKTNLEWAYLLGDFGVKVAGWTATVVEPVRELFFGDICGQGLPFYTGNLVYRCRIPGGRETSIAVPRFGAPLLSVKLDGRQAGKIAFPPYRLDLGFLSEEQHSLEIMSFGNRANAFGPVHNCDPHLTWHGPHCWRTEGDQWADEYQLKPTGILVAPIVLTPA